MSPHNRASYENLKNKSTQKNNENSLARLGGPLYCFCVFSEGYQLKMVARFAFLYFVNWKHNWLELPNL